MALKLVSSNADPQDAGPYLLTPAQHRASAEQLWRAGNHELARQHANLARVIERSADVRVP